MVYIGMPYKQKRYKNLGQENKAEVFVFEKKEREHLK